MFVSPRKDCSHIKADELYPLEKFKYLPFSKLKCAECSEITELWICLHCSKSFCGRYINNHFKGHFEKNESHCICLSILDLSVWCYKCITDGFSDPGSYIESPISDSYIGIFSEFKFGENFRPTEEAISNSLQFTHAKSKDMKYNNFIELLKNLHFKNVVFLTGAGISTSAGIPDFRSNTGVFQSITEKYNLKSPEMFFSKDLFIKQPELFYDFLRKLDTEKYNPTITHYFMRYLIQEKGIGKMIFTQNIDSLELKAGIDKSKIVFAHGNSSEAHCAKCNEEIDIEEVRECIKNFEVKKCPKCSGPCKPKIVLYGENLPNNFYENTPILCDADLLS